MEIRKATTCQKDSQATGNDGVPTEIFKQNINIWINQIKFLIQNVTTEEMPGGWKQGAIALIYKADVLNL